MANTLTVRTCECEANRKRSEFECNRPSGYVNYTFHTLGSRYVYMIFYQRTHLCGSGGRSMVKSAAEKICSTLGPAEIRTSEVLEMTAAQAKQWVDKRAKTYIDKQLRKIAVEDYGRYPHC